MKPLYALNIVLFIEISNHINLGATDVQAYNALVTYGNTVKSANPTCKLIVSKAFSFDWDATKEGYRQSVNNMIDAAVSPTWDAVVDITTDPIGQPYATSAGGGMDRFAVLCAAKVNTV